MQGLSYAVDIALCIDATGSMGPVIEEVKAQALRFPDDVLKAMAEKDKHVSKFRLRVIAFRDVGFDSEPFQVSEFFVVPDERVAFEAFVRTITAGGGGDEPESGLEAVALAMASDWDTEADKYRHAIIVWTDASAHPLQTHAGRAPSQLAALIPNSFDDLTDQWQSGQSTSTRLRPEARRIILFAPEAFSWSDMALNWDQSVMFPSRAGNGLAELEYDEIIAMIANSI